MASTLAPSAPVKIRQTKLLIDNRWVDPVEGQSFETLNPATGEADRQGRRRHSRRRRQGRQGRPPGLGKRPLEDDGCRRTRQPDVQAGRPGRARTPRNWPLLESLNCGQDDHRLQGRHRGRRQHPPLLRRLGRQDRRPHGPRPRQLPIVHLAAAGGRRRPDHSLELSAADVGLEVGPGPGLRQHDRAEAGRANAADRAARWANWPWKPASRPA